ncbi:hypothetical protein [Maritimibacter sp. UBA3975]|uniref:hypothetical protein n=1 Tax=Maritimibacter sp. UBA3975 TaxID=1946833 RepID=UPI000C0A998D|nr:hypothetical protein [Maritimibacter sp. UBA3975]MAM60834.1 hypothetical protein [Maritimibacter sp.]|tara:strand:+ start:4182 stop:4574 length:393 start_codon:yes stop_codon:yes gene_type:complete
MAKTKPITWIAVTAGVIITLAVMGSGSEKEAPTQDATAERPIDTSDGFHCLSSWDGSHTAFKRDVKDQLNNPGSFDHVETAVTPVNEAGTHTIRMTYRAENAFGATITTTAYGEYDNDGCSHVVHVYEQR